MLNLNGHSRGSGGHATTQRLTAATAIIALLVGACGSENDTGAGSAGSASTANTAPPATTVAPTTAVAPPTTMAPTSAAPTTTVSPATVPPPTTPPTTTVPATTTAAPATSMAVALLTADDFVGIWMFDGSPYVIQFESDGTYRVAVEDQLATAPVESGDWRLEGTEFIFDTSFSGCPGILDRPGRYEAAMLDDAKTTVQWTVIDDPCEGRKAGLASPWISQ